MIVVRLVEEDVLAVARVAVRGVLFQDAILADAVLGAQLFPKLRADLVAALANLKGDHLARHRARQPFESDKTGKSRSSHALARCDVAEDTSRGAERSLLGNRAPRGDLVASEGGEAANAWVYTANAGRDCLESDSDAAEEVAQATRSLVRRAARFGVVRARAQHSKQREF